MRQHSHHNFKSFPFHYSHCGPRRNIFSFSFFSWQWFWHWNKRKKQNFLLCRPSNTLRTYTHVVFIERFTNIGKKYEIIKILDVWYWFLLIFHYETAKRRVREWVRKKATGYGWTDGVEFFHFFSPVRTFFVFAIYKNWEGRRGMRRYFNFFSLFVTWTHNGKHITSMRGSKRKEKFIKT